MTMKTIPSPDFHYSTEPLLVPRPGAAWADTMVLNPSIIHHAGAYHMVFRATGPWPQAQQPGKPLPYPIFLGYAKSENRGKDWQADFSRPCLAPRLAMSPEGLFLSDPLGNSVVNYANGCIEDPRLFSLEGKHYLTAACRLFPPGPYWENDAPMQCAPEWAGRSREPFGRAARENLTVSVLFAVHLDRLSGGHYEEAFQYAGHLTDPERGDNRDVVVFPGRMRIDGAWSYVQLHRPKEGVRYESSRAGLPPSIFVAVSESLSGFPTPATRHRLLASPLFDWEGDRIGASWTPMDLGDGEWLLPYHGKQNAEVGYTQSFMILREGSDGWPRVVHRCPERLMYARQKWELEGRFPTPCLFTCGGLVDEGQLLMSYGAADTVCGQARVQFDSLIRFVRQFDALGNRSWEGRASERTL